MITRFRFHYVAVWLFLLAFSHWRVGEPRTGLDEAMAALMLLLCMPAGLLVAPLIGATGASPQFWDSRPGITLGWALFLAAGFLQWFVFLPWVVRRARKSA